jgi:hypothetical protein
MDKVRKPNISVRNFGINEIKQKRRKCKEERRVDSGEDKKQRRRLKPI